MTKIAIVTGANSGLGFETTLAFSKNNIQTIMACRNLEKANTAKNKILKKVPKAQLEILPLDLNSFESVRQFAKLFLENYQSLDLLINNAGFMANSFELSEDGIESQYQTNFFGHFLLTGLLIPILKKTTNSRIVSLASIAHRFGNIDIKNINKSSLYIPFKTYSNTKLACLMFSALLNQKLKDTQTISLAAHPGISKTGFSNKLNPFILFMQNTIGDFVLSEQDQGAQSIIEAALDENAPGGGYYGPSGFLEIKGPPKLVGQTNYSKNKKLAEKLWSYAEKVTEISY